MSNPTILKKCRFNKNDYVYLTKNYFADNREKWNIFVITDAYKSGDVYSIRVRGTSGTQYRVPIKYVKDRLCRSKFEAGDYVQLTGRKYGCFRKGAIFRVRYPYRLGEDKAVIVYDEHDDEYAIPENILARV